MAYSQGIYSFPLPYTNGNTTETHYWSDTDNSTVSIGIFANSGIVPTTSPGNRDYRILIVYPSALRANPQMDWSNFEAVAKKFNLNQAY
ncbi:MAG: hypothetical protein JNL32_15575 [Candidatus Kapabacteria bacterium]|nr:hypothetical protein [Candidatus Kapabacteria bacterium]